MKFEQASKHLKNGHKIRRSSWDPGICFNNPTVFISVESTLADDWEIISRTFDFQEAATRLSRGSLARIRRRSWDPGEHICSLGSGSFSHMVSTLNSVSHYKPKWGERDRYLISLTPDDLRATDWEEILN